MAHTEHRFSCRLEWTGAAAGPAKDHASYSRDLEVEIEGKPSLRMSAAPAFKGDASVHNPEDLLVAALSACHALTYLALAAHAKIAVLGYEDDASGVMKMHEGKMRFTEVVLRPVVTVEPGTDRDKALELHHPAHEQCFIASSVGFPVSVEPEVRFAGM